MADEGYVTIAIRRRRFLEMAIDLALSLRAHDRRPISLLVDAHIERRLGPHRTVFDRIVRVPEERMRGRSVKFALAELSPYPRTMFLDADSLVLGSLEPAWAQAWGAPLRLVGELLGRGDDRRHHGHSTRGLMERFDLDAYLKSNSGLIYLEREAAETLEECRRVYLEELPSAVSIPLDYLPDELAFGVVGGRRGVAVFPEPAPMLWPDEIRQLDLDAPLRPLLHLIGPPPTRVWRRILDGILERRRLHGLAPGWALAWRHERFKVRSNQ